MKTTSVTPLAANAASAQSTRRRPPTSAKHLGVSAVVGMSRWPRPAPMTMAFMGRGSPSRRLLADEWLHLPHPDVAEPHRVAVELQRDRGPVRVLLVLRP